MFLYELAIALDLRSPDVVEAASGLGMGHLSPASELDPQQVAALRAHFAPGAPPPLAPLGAPPADPGAGAPAMAPPGWGAPAPPPGPPPAGYPPPASAPGPAAWGPPAPGDAVGPGPSFAYPAGPSTAPPMSAPPAGPQAPAHWGPPTGPGGPGVPGPGPAPSSPGGTSRGQIAVIGVVVVLVLGLFGFMVLNTGPDKQREEAIAAGPADGAEGGIGVGLSEGAGIVTSTTKPESATTAAPEQPQASTTADPDVAVDTRAFCSNGREVGAFELRLAAASADENFEELVSLVKERRVAWLENVNAMVAAAAPSHRANIVKYRDGYLAYFDVIEGSSSFSEVISAMDQDLLNGAVTGGTAINRDLLHLCS